MLARPRDSQAGCDLFVFILARPRANLVLTFFEASKGHQSALSSLQAYNLRPKQTPNCLNLSPRADGNSSAFESGEAPPSAIKGSAGTAARASTGGGRVSGREGPLAASRARPRRQGPIGLGVETVLLVAVARQVAKERLL